VILDGSAFANSYLLQQSRELARRWLPLVKYGTWHNQKPALWGKQMATTYRHLMLELQTPQESLESQDERLVAAVRLRFELRQRQRGIIISTSFVSIDRLSLKISYRDCAEPSHVHCVEGELALLEFPLRAAAKQ
jgi:hypothetical protein